MTREQMNNDILNQVVKMRQAGLSEEEIKQNVEGLQRLRDIVLKLNALAENIAELEKLAKVTDIDEVQKELNNMQSILN